MPRRLLILVLTLCLLAGGTVLFHHFSAEPTEAPTRMAALGLMLLDGDDGVSVLAVRDGSPADRAGILPGDVVLQADGTDVGDILQLEELLAQAQMQMRLELRRSQEELITLQLNVQ